MLLGPTGGTRAEPTLRRFGLCVAVAIAAMLFVVLPAQLGSSAPPPTALQLNGTSQYVTFGAAPGLGAAQFTLETWFKRTGAGVGTGTGSGGITSAIPLITKGRAEAETPANLNMNYFLGIDATSGRLVADYEDTAGGLNHPVTGTAVVTSNVWHHAAVTFNGTALTLYLDGVADGVPLATTATPESTSIQHAALGTAMNSTGVAAGFFQGILDEARIWNVARTALEINGSRSQEITSAAGLVARWGLNEGAGSTIGDSTGNLNIGTAAASPTWSTDVPTLTAAPAWNAGLYLGGVSGYVTFGAAPSLGASQFTLETWFKRTGAGAGQQTGTGGLASAVPLVTKGRNEAEGSNLDMNYFLGIDTASNHLAVDFEEGAAGATPGQNHPLIGGTEVTNNVWHHAAATYDGQTWRIYLDGALDGTLPVGQPARSDSIQHAALGTAMTSTGIAGGFFQGVLDEARIWNYARTQTQIQATKDFEVSSGSGVVGRWGLNEGGGTSAATSFGVATGTINNAGWVAGAPVTPGGDATPPAQPQGLAATAGNGSVSLSWTPNTDADLRGYNLYRSTSSPVSTSGTPVNGGTPLGAASYTDNGVSNGTTYYYAVVAVDNSWNASPPSAEASATPQAPAGPHALSFNGSSQYVTMGPAAGLGAAQFTLETWFRRTGAGVGTSTGSGGIASAVPLVTKGRAEAETPANLNMNYFLGIDSSAGVLVGDFEDTTNGGNHPVTGSAVISQNVWHHAAATFDGSYWRLYLDGVLDAKLAVSATPEASSIQHAALASALNSSGVAAGFFQGQLDEARIWSYARVGDQIRAARDAEIDSAAGLVGRFGLDEGTGTTAGNSAGAPGGTLVNGPSWISGYGFFEDGTAPAAPSGFTASGGDGEVTLSWTANGAADLAGYDLYRSTSTPVDTSGTPLNGSDLLRTTSYADPGLTNGTTYYYALVAVDGANNRSAASQASATPRPASHALSFNGSSQYVTMGPAAALGAAQFTLETWFRRTGAGLGTSTGSGGVTAVPLVTKGRAEAETPANLNMNYFLGIDSSAGVLVADFEDTTNGGNHPVSGSTVISQSVWHHAAATFDGSYWRLYLDGVLETKLAVAATPESSSIQHAALGSALTSNGTAAGFFQGDLDEARIWSSARSGAQLRSSRNSELASAPGLLARFGMNEGSGSTVGNSAGTPSGTAVGSPTWIAGYGFPQDTTAPAAPQNLAASPDDGSANLTWNASGGTDLAGYNLYRSTSSPVSTTGTPVNGTDLLQGTSYSDTQLTNGTTYYYALVAVDSSDNRSAPSAEASATPALGDPVLVGAGDIAVCGSPNDEATADLLDTAPSAAVFAGGDNVYENGLLSEFQQCYGPSWGRPGIKPRTRPVAGNHEYGNGANSGDGYFDYFNGIGSFTGPAGDRDKGYYSYDIDNYWHVVVPNTECGIDAACSMAAQVDWLRADLAANRSKNVIATWHRPRWTSGATRPGDTRQQALWQAVYEYGAELVLVGHDHHYERFAPQNASGQADPVYGVREIIVGTGGASFTGAGSTAVANSEVRNGNTYGVLKLRLHPSSYDWQFIPTAGGTFTDSGTSATHAAPSVPPVVDSVVIDQTSPRTNDTLTATVTSHDANGDQVTYAYQWTKNGVDLAGRTAATLNLAAAGNGDKGDQIALRVTANDGTSTSAPRTSDAVGVQNSSPTATVTLNNHTPGTNALLTATATRADADGDGVTLTYVWKVNGVVRKTTSASTSLTDTFDLSQAGNGDAGDTITVEATPFDGSVSGGSAIDTAVVDAAPSAPTGLSALLSTTAVTLDWADNGESDLAGYNVYRASAEGGPYTKLNGALLAASTYRDTTAPVQVTSYYRVTAVDTGSSESPAATSAVFRPLAFRAAATAQGNNLTSLTLLRPAGVVAGDALLAVVDARGTPTIAPPAGWTLVRSDTNGTTLRQALYVRIAQAGEPTSYTWSFGTTVGATGFVLAYAGVNTTAPIDGSSGRVNASSTSISTQAFVTTAPGAAVVGLFGTAINALISPPAGMVEQAEIALSGKQKAEAEAADALQALAGSTGARTATAASAAVSIGQLVALRPANVLPPSDVEPPTAPTNVAATAFSSTRVDLSWAASADNVGVDHYEVYRDGNSVGTTPATSYSDTGLTAGTTYTYTVKAVDAAGNSSPQSAPASATTPNAPPAAIAFRSAATTTTRSGITVTVARPAGTQIGDVLVASVDVTGTPVITAPAGWTLVRRDEAATTLSQTAYVHVVGSSEPSSYVWTFSAAQVASAVVLAYSGVDNAAPVGASSGQANASTTSITAPSVDVPSAGSRLVSLAGIRVNATITPPAGMTERAEVAGGSGGTKNVSEASDAAVDVGSTGSRTSVASRAGVNIGQLVVLRRAP